jgi:hypothetical protein
MLAGCGSSAPAVPRPVQVTLTAPVDGARVNVRNLLVLGTVDPAGSVIRIAGGRVRVAHGTFRHWMSVRQGFTRIRIVATAPGYVPALLSVAIRNGRSRNARPSPAAAATGSFVDRANQLCAQSHTEALGIALSNAAKVNTPEGYVRLVQRMSGPGGHLVGQLRSIHAPPSKAKAYAAFLANYAVMMSDVTRLLSDWQAHQLARTLPDIDSLITAFQAVGRRGNALDLLACTNSIG